MLDVVIDVVEVSGQLHIIAEHDLKHVVAVAGYRKRDALKIMGLQGENILEVIDVVERDAEVTHECLGAAQLADATQQREGDVAVEPCQCLDFAHGCLAAVARLEDVVGHALQAQALRPWQDMVKREDVDEDALIERPV